MAFLLLYIDENVTFDAPKLTKELRSLESIQSLPSEDECSFVCNFCVGGDCATIRIKNDAESINIDTVGEVGLAAAFALQSMISSDVHLIDDSYAFDLVIRDFPTLNDLRDAINREYG